MGLCPLHESAVFASTGPDLRRFVTLQLDAPGRIS